MTALVDMRKIWARRFKKAFGRRHIIPDLWPTILTCDLNARTVGDCGDGAIAFPDRACSARAERGP
jgi:hypothetical protein